MITTYELLADVFVPFSKLNHRGRTNDRPGHLLVLDEDRRVLGFLDGRSKTAAAGNVSLADDADLQKVKTWIADQLAAKRLVQVTAPAANLQAQATPQAAAPKPVIDPPKPPEEKK